jgi:hypothetical protein
MLTVVAAYLLPIIRGPDGLVLDYAAAIARIAAAVPAARADPRADADRVVLWFFSGGAMFGAGWLRDAPPWLRGIAAGTARHARRCARPPSGCERRQAV